MDVSEKLGKVIEQCLKNDSIDTLNAILEKDNYEIKVDEFYS